MPSIHFPFGGSTADRTLNCHGWRKAADALPKIDRTSAAAERGTAMHDLMERVLLNETSVMQELAESPDHGFDDYDVGHLLAAERMVAEVFKKYGVTEFACEPLMQLADDIGGSTDIIAAGEKHCIVLDYKFGRQPVAADSNAQLLFYHMLAKNSPEVADLTHRPNVVGVIIQPAVSFEADVYEFLPEEVAAFEPRMMDAINIARKGGKLNAGSHCTFCPNEPYCQAKLTQVKAVQRISIEQQEMLAAALHMLPQLKSFISAAEDEALRILKEGLPVPGYKLVHKKATRKWANESAAKAALLGTLLPEKELMNPESLKSPAQIDRVLKTHKVKFDFKSLLDTTEPDTTFAPEDDPREKIIVQDETRAKLSAILHSNKS
jgi:hypothetical protein